MSDICSSCTVVVLYVIIPCYTRHPFIGSLGCCIFVNEIRPWVKCNNYRHNNFSVCDEIQFYVFLCNHCSPSYYKYASHLYHIHSYHWYKTLVYFYAMPYTKAFIAAQDRWLCRFWLEAFFITCGEWHSEFISGIMSSTMAGGIFIRRVPALLFAYRMILTGFTGGNGLSRVLYFADIRRITLALPKILIIYI